MARQSFDTKTSFLQMIRSYLQGKSTAEESVFLERYYQDFEKHQGIIQSLSGAEKQALEEKIEARIFQRIGQQPVVRRMKIYRWAAAAAIAGLIIGGGVYYIQNDKPATVTAVVAPNNDLEPGGNKATLTLADGRKIVLDDVRPGEISTQNGVRVSKTNDGKLIYGFSSPTNAIVYNTIQTPAGGEYQLVLADGTKVWLNASSSLQFPTAFNGAERTVNLTGEGYFEVAPNKSKAFKVRVNGSEIDVLGTHFNIMAYANESSLKTTLLEGSVKVTHEGNTKLLKPGQQASITNNISVAEADVEKAVAWKNGYFKFDKDDVQTVMNQLARWYDVEVVYADGIPKDQFSGKMRRNVKASKALEWLAATGLKCRIEGRKIIVQGN